MLTNFFFTISFAHSAQGRERQGGKRQAREDHIGPGHLERECVMLGLVELHVLILFTFIYFMQT